ncbi:MAG: hypothetical protein AABN33_12410 [Acidobacteriota bacterium]
MNTDIVVAIIGGSAAVVAAIIGLFAIRKRDRNSPSATPEIEGRKSLARRVISQTTAMLFIDLMRLLYIASNASVREANAGRHLEFVNFATEHLDELKSHFSRLSNALGTDLEEQSCELERQLSYMLNELKTEQDLRHGYDDYFEKMHKIGGELHKFCMAALGDSYERSFERVLGKIDEQLTRKRSAIKKVALDEVWSLRLDTQTKLLKSRELGEAGLYSIRDDMTHRMAIQYFIVDYKILRELAAA